MESASSLQINPEGTVIKLRRGFIWHLVGLPKARGLSTCPNEGAGTYFLAMGRQNIGAVPRRDFSISLTYSRGPQFDSNECFRPTRNALTTPSTNCALGFAGGHPGYPIALKTHRWNVEFNGQELLYGKALLWYRSNKGSWNNWETFKETLRMAFYPVHYQEDLELEISRRIQRYSESAIHYIIDLQTLIRRHGGLTTEQETLRLYRNLFPKFRHYTRRMNFWDTPSLVCKILESENLREETFSLVQQKALSDLYEAFSLV
ncbi:hypothetical protein JTB14_007512 [Gonioctena quinquepunctata]|nr:hypothetical protein JTB14_007512 [Gonioctena quinquepunctata]